MIKTSIETRTIKEKRYLCDYLIQQFYLVFFDFLLYFIIPNLNNVFPRFDFGNLLLRKTPFTRIVFSPLFKERKCGIFLFHQKLCVSTLYS